MDPAVGLVFPWAGLDSVPSLSGLIMELDRKGLRTEVFTYVDEKLVVPSFGSRVALRVIGRTDSNPRQAEDGRLRRMMHRIRGAISLRLSFLRLGMRAIRGGVRCWVAVDPEGLRYTAWMNMFHRRPVVYYSLELLLEGETVTAGERRLKTAERRLARRVAAIVIQDPARGAILADDDGIQSQKFMFVPNSPLGPPKQLRSRHWHDRFALPSDARVLLHSGAVATWAGVDILLPHLESWPDPWVLVVHSRMRLEDRSWLEDLAGGGRDRLFLSQQPVPRQEFDALIDGADAGVAFYVPDPGSSYTMTNLTTLGLSSGKVAYYLRSGLPLIVNDTTDLASLVAEENCGVVVHSGSEVGEALRTLTQHYEEMAHRARSTFAARLDPEESLGELVGYLENLAS